MRSGPAVTTFPRTDRVFAAFVARCLADVAEPDAETLEASLRRWHTRAAVRVAEDIAGFGWGSTWYVYRDGRPEPGDDPDWWLDPACAHVGFGRDGTFVVANAAAGRLVGMDDGLVGRHWSELVPPAATTDDAGHLWAILDGGEVAQSVFDRPLPDGTRRVIEYRSVRCPEGGYESWWREIAVLAEGC